MGRSKEEDMKVRITRERKKKENQELNKLNTGVSVTSSEEVMRELGKIETDSDEVQAVKSEVNIDIPIVCKGVTDRDKLREQILQERCITSACCGGRCG